MEESIPPKYVAGTGNLHAKLMVVGEAPSAEDEKTGMSFSGPAGRLLDEQLINAGSSLSDVYRTNIFKYRPPDDKLYRIPELKVQPDHFHSQLREEIKSVNPNTILALGNLSLYTLTGKSNITKYRGSILPCTFLSGYKVVAGLGYPALLRAGYTSTKRQKGVADNDQVVNLPYNSRVYAQWDILRAVKESSHKEFPTLPSLHIIKTATQLYSFFDRYKDKTKVAVDIETYKCIPTCIAFAFSPTFAVSVPLFSLGDLKISENELTSIWKILAKFFSGTLFPFQPAPKIIGQNFKFDHEKLLRPLGFNLSPDIYTDTMFLAHALHPELPKGLGFLTSVYSKHPYYKDEGKEFDPRKDRIDRLLNYNATDAAVTFEICEKMEKEVTALGLHDFVFNYLNHMHPLYMGIEREGIAIDYGKRAELTWKYEERLEKIEEELDSIAEGKFNLRSPLQTKKLLYGKLKLPERATTDDDALVSLLANSCKEPKQSVAIQLILDGRRVSKSLTTYLRASPDYDERMRSQYRIVGTETGRTSTSKLDSPVRPTNVGLAFQTLTKHGDIGADIGEILCADEGFEFIEVDLSQAEARVVANLCGDSELLSLFDTADIHTLTASWIFGRTNISSDERFIGKKTRHGGNYDMGKHRHMIEVNNDAKRFGIGSVTAGIFQPLTISEWRAGQNLEIFHKYSPKIRGVFHSEIQRLLQENNRVIINPFGRRRQFLDRFGDSLFKEAYAQIPQSTVRDRMGTGMLRIKTRIPPLRICMESHDSFTAQIKPKNKLEFCQIIKEELEKPIDFSRCSIPREPLIIPCEFKSGPNLKNLTKYKVA